MFIYYQELKGKNKKIFDVDNIDSIDDTTFKNWFALDKEQFQIVCSFFVTCQPKHVAVLLYKMQTSLSDEQLSFLFGVCRRTIENYMN